MFKISLARGQAARLVARLKHKMGNDLGAIPNPGLARLRTAISDPTIVTSPAVCWGLEPFAAVPFFLLGASDSQGYSQWFQWLVPTGTVLAGLSLIALCFVAWCLNLIALPGNWISVALLAAFAWLGPQDSRVSIGYLPVVAAGVCALAGEALEFLASAAGAQRAGASRRSTLYALIGSFVGAILGALVGLPVPVIGPVLAAILFAGLGATAGAMYGEWSDGRPWRESWSIGHAAFWGRTFGTLGKFSAGLVILLIAAGSILF